MTPESECLYISFYPYLGLGLSGFLCAGSVSARRVSFQQRLKPAATLDQTQTLAKSIKFPILACVRCPFQSTSPTATKSLQAPVLRYLDTYLDCDSNRLLVYGQSPYCTKILDFRGFDSSMILISKGVIPRPIGNIPEISSQRILTVRFLVGDWAYASQTMPSAFCWRPTSAVYKCSVPYMLALNKTSAAFPMVS